MVAGDRRKESKDLEEKEELKEMYGLIEIYKINGEFQWISSQMNHVRNSELYSYAADTKGAFVQPAFYEAFGLTVVEAKTCGLPTFATFHGGPAEIIVHGKSGFHIDPYQGDKASELIVSFFEKCRDDPTHWEKISQEGYLTWNSTGNYGPKRASLTNAAPWILTVAASNRRFIGKVVLGIDEIIEGNARNGFDIGAQKLLLIRAEDASTCDNGRICDVSFLNLNKTLAEGKIIFCEELIIDIDSEISKATGKIFADDVDFKFVYPFPASCLSVHNGERIKSYINSTK
ncbi:hypothetical protein GIB67_042754 [Kingdonia uniflora]|uniref:sucrose synthase n=1 Tax=Kingdonia uniflora TaxID=39325 RepID=A0A7J7L106_9MAGN|nr:hypothetical protein GIB67_042754 [Kingdonia uniflora]